MPGFTLFAFMWCAAILFHQLFQGRFGVLDGTSLLTFVALWGLMRPASLPRFALVLAIHLAVVVAEMPVVVNHWLLMGATSLGLLLYLLPRLRELGTGASEPSLAAALRSVRAQIVIVYLFATLAKLNAGFFDPSGSCAAEHYQRLAGSALPTAPWAIWAAIWGTLVIEAGLPLMLLVRRTRLLAFAGGWVFHAMLGWNGYWDFSMVAAAYYASFAPPGLIEGWHRAVRKQPWLARLHELARGMSGRPLAFPVAAALLLLPAGLAALSDASSREVVLAWNHAGRIVWAFAWSGIGLALLVAFRATPGRAELSPEVLPASPWWHRPALLLAPALLFANGLSPYLGLKTENSYTMFSNIVTEGGTWNHYVMPRSLRIFGFQDEPLRILRSNDPYLRRLARQDFRLVPLELRRYVAEHPDVSLVYESSEGPVVARRAADDAFLARSPHPLLAKLLLFRPVASPERNVCLH